MTGMSNDMSEEQTVTFVSGTPEYTIEYDTHNDMGTIEIHTEFRLKTLALNSSMTASAGYGLYFILLWNNYSDGYLCKTSLKLTSSSDTFNCYDIYNTSSALANDTTDNSVLDSTKTNTTYTTSGSTTYVTVYVHV